jgi:hypothetical protein
VPLLQRHHQSSGNSIHLPIACGLVAALLTSVTL